MKVYKGFGLCFLLSLGFFTFSFNAQAKTLWKSEDGSMEITENFFGKKQNLVVNGEKVDKDASYIHHIDRGYFIILYDKDDILNDSELNIFFAQMEERTIKVCLRKGKEIECWWTPFSDIVPYGTIPAKAIFMTGQKDIFIRKHDSVFVIPSNKDIQIQLGKGSLTDILYCENSYWFSSASAITQYDSLFNKIKQYQVEQQRKLFCNSCATDNGTNKTISISVNLSNKNINYYRDNILLFEKIPFDKTLDDQFVCNKIKKMKISK